MYMNIKYINTQVYTVFVTGIIDKECYLHKMWWKIYNLEQYLTNLQVKISDKVIFKHSINILVVKNK